MSIERGAAVEALQRVRMSYAEYEALPPEVHAEWVDGEAVIMAASGNYVHNEIALRLRDAFRRDLPRTRQSTDLTTYLPRNRERRPDVIVMSRPPQGEYPVVAVDGPPVLVVEVVSRSTQAEDWIRKSEDYLAAGIQQYWLVDPRLRELTVLERDEGVWRELLRLHDDRPAGTVKVDSYGTVAVDLRDLFDI